MKTAKELMERLLGDEAFAKEINDAVLAKKDANAPDYADAYVAVAAEKGYAITAEQVRRLREKQTEEISEEELGKAAGGTACSWITVTTTTVTTSATATTVKVSSC